MKDSSSIQISLTYFFKSIRFDCFQNILEKKKRQLREKLTFSAEGGGFEPPVRLPARQFSKLLVSATHPSFRKL